VPGFAANRVRLAELLEDSCSEPAVYTPKGGGPAIDTLAVLYPGASTFGNGDPQASQPHTIIALPADDIPASKRGDVITHRGRDWTVEHLVKRGSVDVQVLVL
jgi:hypothetical protein